MDKVKKTLVLCSLVAVSSVRQFEREIQEDQRKKAKITLDDIKPNSGKIEPADWTT